MVQKLRDWIIKFRFFIKHVVFIIFSLFLTCKILFFFKIDKQKFYVKVHYLITILACNFSQRQPNKNLMSLPWTWLWLVVIIEANITRYWFILKMNLIQSWSKWWTDVFTTNLSKKLFPLKIRRIPQQKLFSHKRIFEIRLFGGKSN